jgi:hypothetical protein
VIVQEYAMAVGADKVTAPIKLLRSEVVVGGWRQKIESIRYCQGECMHKVSNLGIIKVIEKP